VTVTRSRPQGPQRGPQLGALPPDPLTGQEALTLGADHDLDLILMDWQMPEMDGLTATHRLLGLYPDRDLRIAAHTAHTAHTAPEDKAQSAAAGMVGHLRKPFTLEELEALVHQHTPSSKARVLNANKVA
jgi:CheY-like chemotaxis protein